MAQIIALFSIIFSHLFVVSRLNFFPYPELFIYPYLKNIGLTPYTQIFDQHFPGVMFLPINIATLGFNHPSAMFLLHSIVIVATHLLIYLISKSLLKDKKLALLANVFYLLWHPYLEGNVLWIDSFVPLTLLPSYFFLQKSKFENNKYLYFSGIFLGLSLTLKQVLAPLIILLILIAWIVSKNKKKVFIFAFLTAIPMGIFSLSYLINGTFGDLFYWTVTFNTSTFAEMGRKYPTNIEILKFIVIFTPAFVFILLSYLRKKRILLSIFILGSLIFAYARFDFVHLQPALAFLAITSILLLEYIPKSLRKSLVFLYILLALIPIRSRLLELKGERVMFFTEQEFLMADEVYKNANHDDTIFVMGTTPHLYYITKTRPPSDLFVFQFPWFLVEVEDAIYEGLINDPPKIVFRDPTAEVQGMNLVEYMPQINAYISQNYTLDSKIGEVEVLLPNENSN